MCDLCNEETKALAKEHMKYLAIRMRELSRLYDDMASGKVKPHSEQAKNMSYTARMLVRELVAEWV